MHRFSSQNRRRQTQSQRGNENPWWYVPLGLVVIVALMSSCLILMDSYGWRGIAGLCFGGAVGALMVVSQRPGGDFPSVFGVLVVACSLLMATTLVLDSGIGLQAETQTRDMFLAMGAATTAVLGWGWLAWRAARHRWSRPGWSYSWSGEIQKRLDGLDAAKRAQLAALLDLPHKAPAKSSAAALLKQYGERWPAAGLQPLASLLHKMLDRHEDQQLVLVLDGEVSQLSTEKIDALMTELRRKTNDYSLTCRTVDDGSIKLILDGDGDALRVLRALHRSGQLTELCGLPITAIYRADRGDSDETPPSATSSTVVKILLLAANPPDTSPVQVGQEMQMVQEALRAGTLRDRFIVAQEWVVSASTLRRHLLRHRPSAVHFSGHGTARGGLVLEAERDLPVQRGVPPFVIAELFGILRDNMRLVVLNACYSARQAQALAEYIDCVAGMVSHLSDASALRFAHAFYEAIAFGRSVKVAFALGCNAISQDQAQTTEVMRLFTREHVDPEQVILTQYMGVHPPARIYK